MPPPSLPIPAKRALPSKEATLFRELLSLYEARQLKKAQKTADQILKKFPDHGETLCMKGLVLTHMGKRDEGMDLVKKGMRLDLTSHICWHVFGLIQKGEKNYEEALKSYTQALRFDKENLNILRDAAHLQTQLRIYDGLVETRHTLLRLRPALRQNWIALAVAHHLNGELGEAKKVLERYEGMVKDIPDYDVEHSETMLYHVRLLEDLGQFSEALSLLDTNAKARIIVDRTAVMEFRARLLTKSGDTAEAEHAWRALIQQNPDSHDYYHGFLSNQGIDTTSTSDENRSKSVKVLKEFSEQIPRATAPRRLALLYSTGDEFKVLIRAYLIAGLSKGIPSLFVDIKALYEDPEKKSVIEGLVETWREALASGNSTPFDSASPPAESSPSSESEPPTTYLWTLYFLAQHYSDLGQHERSISLLDEALTHTPTLPELHTCKARGLKRSGDLLQAAKSLNDARLLDLQDRFLNTKCGKYRLRAGFLEEAQDILGLFTKKDAPSPGSDLEDMQSLLFLAEDGDAHNRVGKLGIALKRYLSIQKVFDEIEDDQYDFHGYSLRKFTINIYLNLIAWEDKLRSNAAYVHAALEASRIFVRVHDQPSLLTTQNTTVPVSDAEKKAKKKAKKAEKKIEESKKATTPASEDKGLEAPVVKDDDPDGSKALSSPDGLERAAKLLNPLTTLAKKNPEIWIAIYDVAVRRKKHLQAVKALSYVHALNPDHPELHIRLIDFKKTLVSLPQQPPAPIGPAVAAALSSLFPEDLSLEVFNSQYLQKHSTSAPAILAVGKSSLELGASESEVTDTLFTTFNPEVSLTIKDALKFASFLASIKSSRIDEFRSRCDAKFTLSTVFKSLADQEALRKGVCDNSIDGGEKDEIVN